MASKQYLFSTLPVFQRCRYSPHSGDGIYVKRTQGSEGEKKPTLYQKGRISKSTGKSFITIQNIKVAPVTHKQL